MPDRRITVLLIEDDDDDYFIAKELFAEFPQGEYHLDRVADFNSALHAFDNCHHDLYLVDYRLGRHNGLELLGEALKRGCTAPMIMLTGQREHDVDMQAMHAGAVDYLVKGQLDPTTLERAMRYALQQKRHEENIRAVNQQLEERVQDRTAELARVNESLQAEIAVRQHAEDALREADRRKDEFLATLAHELRNPLASISSALQLLELDFGDPAELLRLHKLMMRQVEQLVRLIDDLLDVSRISRGKLNLRWENVALSETLESAVDACRPAISSNSHELHVELPEAPLHIHGDKVRLTQIICNLLTNAARYTPKGGRLELSAQRSDGAAIIQVRDNGIGIPPDKLADIFGMFTQVDNSKTRSQGGLGIGLTLVKTLVELHGGSITAKSPGVHRGSEFTVRLPLAQDIQAPPPLAAQASKSADEPLVARNILIVDDNESAAHLLSRLLEKLGQHVRVVHSGSAALETIPTLRPDLIISDIGMPGMSGYELARKVRLLQDISQPV
ncbi:MAG TPA: response regulator, partial [Pirellulaceae bacterium]|nr:response regulator [Pirellulaceae bacterium]